VRFIDANVFVYHMAQDPRHGRAATSIIKRIEGGEEAATSTLVLSQVCGYLKWKKRVEVIASFIGFLRSLPNLSKVETTFTDLVLAQGYHLEHKLDESLWDDVILAQQMKRLQIHEIYSNDTDFDLIPGVHRIFR